MPPLPARSLSTSGLVVYLGREYQNLLNIREESRFVSQIVRHAGYDSQTSDNDIALLRLSAPLGFTDYILPVCLAAEDSEFAAGTSCFVTGWGTVGENGEFRWYGCSLVFRPFTEIHRGVKDLLSRYIYIRAGQRLQCLIAINRMISLINHD